MDVILSFLAKPVVDKHGIILVHITYPPLRGSPGWQFYIKNFSKFASENEETGRFNLESHSEPTLKISCSVLLNSFKDLFFFQLCLSERLKIRSVFILSSKN